MGLEVFYVGFGSFLGGVLRYILGKICIFSEFSFITTLLINILGSFFIGLIMGLTKRKIINENISLFLKVGFCGGFTTFSAFSLEVFSLFENKNYFQGLLYFTTTPIVCLFGVFLGLLLTKEKSI